MFHMTPSSTTTPLPPAALQQMLAAAFAGGTITVRDDTHLHEGHNREVNQYGGHYKIRLIWAGFAGMSRVNRQRLVQQALQQPWQAGRIHALTLQLLTPQEAA